MSDYEDVDASTGDGGVAVVTDSTTYLPRSLVERWNIHEVSLYVGWDGDLRPEHEYVDLNAFYARLKESPQLPTTSQPSVGDFLECYRAAARRRPRRDLDPHRRGPVWHLRERPEAARLLAEEGQPGTRACARRARREREAWAAWCCSPRVSPRRGPRSRRWWTRSVAARESLDIWFCLDTLEYLRRGGRIGAAQAMVGTALKIKPILTFGTEIAPVGRVRTHRRALERMNAYLHELRDRGASDWIVQHAQSNVDAELLVAEGTAIFDSEPLFCTEVGPVLGAHLGSGMLVGGMTRPDMSGEI